MKKEISKKIKLRLIYHLTDIISSEELILFQAEQNENYFKNKIENSNIESDFDKKDLLNYLDELFSSVAEPAVDIFLEENLQEQE